MSMGDLMKNVYFEDLSHEKPYQCYEQNNQDSSWRVIPHWHHYAEIVYVLSGSIHVFLNGSYHRLLQGELVFINSQAIHAFHADPRGASQLIILKFDKRLLHGNIQTAQDPLLNHLLSDESRILPDGFIFVKEQASEPLRYLRCIRKELEHSPFGYELAIRTHVSSLFMWIIRQKELEFRAAFQILRPVSDTSLQCIQTIMANIHEHYQKALTADEAAKQCRLSYSHFSRKFKEVSGKTFSQYVNLVRVTEAEKLLTTGSLTITEIGLEVGFANTSYFIKQFQKFRSSSPLQFRKKLTAVHLP